MKKYREVEEESNSKGAMASSGLWRMNHSQLYSDNENQMAYLYSDTVACLFYGVLRGSCLDEADLRTDKP